MESKTLKSESKVIALFIPTSLVLPNEVGDRVVSPSLTFFGKVRVAFEEKDSGVSIKSDSPALVVRVGYEELEAIAHLASHVPLREGCFLIANDPSILPDALFNSAAAVNPIPKIDLVTATERLLKVFDVVSAPPRYSPEPPKEGEFTDTDILEDDSDDF